MKFSTKAIHVGQEPDKETGAMIPPVYLTSTYKQEAPDQHKEKDFTDFINEYSFSIQNAKVEPSLANLEEGIAVQFQRLGYYILDKDAKGGQLVFNKTVGLRDNWSKKQ